MDLSHSQFEILRIPYQESIFLEGSAGSGKTTAGVFRLRQLLELGTPGETVLIWVPQRTLAQPYVELLQEGGLVRGGFVSILTLDGLAQRMIDLFWPIVADKVDFGHRYLLPTYLTLESAQYFMAYIVRPLLDEGFFDSIHLDRNRLYSQILDNLNKAALVGFEVTDIGERLKQAWIGESGQLSVYDDVQTCANLFRQYCYQNNLLDFSLQIELFWKVIWPDPFCRNYLMKTFRHLLVDNVEEDTPVAHDILRDWIPMMDSSLVIYDLNAGFRNFLGADPLSAETIKLVCKRHLFFLDNFVISPGLAQLGNDLFAKISHSETMDLSQLTPTQDTNEFNDTPFNYKIHRYYPEMLDWVAGETQSLLIKQGVPENQVVILAPYMPDALRFSLQIRLEELGIPVRSHRPSRSLREEPATRCLLTLASLCFPSWGNLPDRLDVAYAFVQAIQGMDLVRAQLLTQIVYRHKDGIFSLSSFEAILPEVQQRITYNLGMRYEALRNWLMANQELDEDFGHFISRLFGEILTQPGYGYNSSLDAGVITANLIESIQKFRKAVGDCIGFDGAPLGKVFLETLQDGLVAAQYLLPWQLQATQGVLIAPAFTFLLNNRPVDYQFWLDIGSRGWYNRLEQPLTQPYVLSRNWPKGKAWTDFDEVHSSEVQLQKLIRGLLSRCRQGIFLGLSQLDDQGYEESGPLLKAFQSIILNLSQQDEDEG